MSEGVSRMRIQIPEKLIPIFEGLARYRGAYGGRGSTKSWTFARKLILRSCTQYNFRALCCRELQKSTKDSVHHLLKSQIKMMGLEDQFEIGEKYIRNIWGGEFMFYGLRSNPDEIKSMEGIDVAWVEEAHAVSEKSWKFLIPTIRKPNSEIWLTFNPDVETDPTYKRFIKNPPPNSKIVKINFSDNPWFGDPLETEMNHLKAVDYDEYEHVWLGMPYARRANQLNALDWIIHAMHNQLEPDGTHPRIRISADISDGGTDKTIICVARHYESYIQVLRMTKHSWPGSIAVTAAAEEIERVWNHWGCSAANGDDLVVDALGVGAGTAGNLLKAGLPVIPYKGGAKSDNINKWRNRRVQSYIVLRDMLREKGICIKPGFIDNQKDIDEFTEHLMAIKRVPGDERREDIETKKALTDREGFSPDWADALAMQCATATPQLMTEQDWHIVTFDGIAA